MEYRPPNGFTLAVRLTRDGEKCFGPGVCELLTLVPKLHSLRAAAAKMGMAYSKAWRIMGDAERILGAPLLEKKTGGVNGGGATLTPRALALIGAYHAFVTDVDSAASAALKKYFDTEVL